MRVPILCTVWASIQLHGCGRLKNHSTAIMKSDTHTHTDYLPSFQPFCCHSVLKFSLFLFCLHRPHPEILAHRLPAYSMFTSLFQNPQLSLIMTHVCSCDRLTANSSSAAATAPHGDTVSHQGCSQ